MAPPARSDPLPRRPVLQEARFAGVLAEATRAFQASVEAIRTLPPERWSERALYALYQQATDCETQLDDHGAKRNATFHELRETVSRVRWLALAASAFAHLSARLPTYPVPNLDALRQDLGGHVAGLVERLGAMLASASEVLVIQWLRIGANWKPAPRPVEAEEAKARPMLPADRPLGGDGDEEENQAARFVGRFLRLASSWSEEARIPRCGLQELTAYMEHFCSEAVARSTEARAHNLQSEFDTYLRGTVEQEQNPQLLVLRSGVSQCFHLLEAVTALTHLYERHWLHEKEHAYRESFQEIVPLETFLDMLVNGCVIRAYRCLRELTPVAESLLQAVARPMEKRLALPKGIHLHARPLSLIVAVVNHHKTPVQMRIGERSVNAASIMSMLILAGSAGEVREVVFHGSEAVLNDLQLLFDSGLGERGLDTMPLRLRRILQS